MAGYSIARLNRIQRRSTAATNRLAGDLLSGGILNSPANTEIEMPRQLPSSEMAMPTLVELWSRSLHDDSLIAVRPVIKRSIITLMRSGYNGDGRAYGDLVALVSYLHRELALEAQQAEDWTVERQRIVLFQRGQSLQTAPDAHSLFNLDFDRRLVAISRILAGTLQPSDLGPQFRHLSRVSAQARDVWVGLHVRLALPASISRFNADNPAGDLVLLPRKFYLQLNATGPAGNAHISYTSDDIHALMAGRIRWGAATEDAALTAFPLLPINEDLWATSTALVADSLAPFMLEAIRLENQWEAAIAQPFEDEVNDFFRSRGFASGPVSMSGYWDPQGPGADVLRDAINGRLATPTGGPPLSGQVDVLAIGEHGCFVIECKSVSAMIKPTNMFGRISPDDADSWRSKVSSKVQWLRPRLDRAVDVGVVVVEGLQYLNSAEETADIPVMPFALVKDMIDQGLAQLA